MFELLFVILLDSGKTIKEYWPDEYVTVEQCQDDGWLKAELYKDQINEKYPNIKGFDIECRRKNSIQI